MPCAQRFEIKINDQILPGSVSLSDREGSKAVSGFRTSESSVEPLPEPIRCRGGDSNEHRIDLLDAVRGYIKQHKQRTESVPFLELFNQFLAAKTDRNQKYQVELRIAQSFAGSAIVPSGGTTA
jgi:hypothetical protein